MHQPMPEGLHLLTHKVVSEFHAELAKTVHAVYRKGRVNPEIERTANFQVSGGQACPPTPKQGNTFGTASGICYTWDLLLLRTL